VLGQAIQLSPRPETTLIFLLDRLVVSQFAGILINASSGNPFIGDVNFGITDLDDPNI
jgi:hypothetical protein